MESNSIRTILDNKLNSVNRKTRNVLSEVFKDRVFTPVYDISLRNQKELAFDRLKKVMESKICSVKDFLSDPNNIFTVHEMLGYCDPSLATKFTVQFNLFGGTIVGLGTQKHEKLFNDIDSLKVVGCFCLTELGYGNNAVEMETTAVWDDKKKVFIFNTPTVNSQKYWITNGAYHANYSVVFAQTYVSGKHEGINAFIIRLRDEKMNPSAGITIDDMGAKHGMNGVDNARIILKNVEAGPDSLLNKLANIDSEKNELKSMIPNKRQRFLATSNRLLSGRICIASMTISGAKLVLLITNKYGLVRLSNGPKGKSDTPISEFQLFQNQIVPLVARLVVYNLGLLHIRNIYSHYLLNSDKYTPAQFNHLVRLICVIKPMVAWFSNEAGNICRERCGGQGYLSINRIEGLIYSAHAAITAEGDSAVLMQKVTKEYVEDYTKGKVEAPRSKDGKQNLFAKKSIFDIDSLMNLIRLREGVLLNNLAEKTLNNLNNIFGLWMQNESDNIQELAFNYGERICLEEAINELKGTNPILEKCYLLEAGQFIKKKIDWFLMNEYVSKEAALDLNEKVNQLIKEVSKHSFEICKGFGIPEHVVFAPIYTGYQEYYKVNQTGGEHHDLPRPKF